jgi:predicted amidohydrolase YtcJ
MSETPLIDADLLITSAHIITMNAAREVYIDGALAMAGSRIVAVGRSADVTRRVKARATRDARGFVMTPGFLDGHIHITAIR